MLRLRSERNIANELALAIDKPDQLLPEIDIGPLNIADVDSARAEVLAGRYDELGLCRPTLSE